MDEKNLLADASRLRFRLVCDPDTKGDGKIHIGCWNEVINGPLSVYDLGWEVPATDLPRGDIRFIVKGDALYRLTENAGSSPEVNTVGIELSCFKVDSQGQRLRDEGSKRWHLLLRVHPSSKLLQVEAAVRLPLRCTGCDGGVAEEVHQCKVCVNTLLCEACWTDQTLGHCVGHHFSMFQL